MATDEGFGVGGLGLFGFLGFSFGFARVSVRVWWWRIRGFLLGGFGA